MSPAPQPQQTATIEAAIDDRRSADRRHQPTTFADALRRRGRRKYFRRSDESTNQYVDCPAPRTIFKVLFIVTCCVLDALFTLVHIDDGAGELNPVMNMALSQGDYFFLAMKLLLTGFGTWLLAIHQNFRLASIALYLIAGGYTLLMLYHVMLFWR